MLRCREVVELAGTDLVARAPLRTRLGVRLHLAMCRHCRTYVRSLRQLAATARTLASGADGADSRRQSVLDEVRRALESPGRGTGPTS